MAWGLGLEVAGCGLAAVVGITMVTPPVMAQDGLYTAEQAERGHVLYDDQCASCHGGLNDLTPGMAALLGDHTFRAQWTGRPLGELFGRIQETMPQDAPGTLTPDQAADIVAYILSGHRFPPGESALAADLGLLMELSFER